MDEIAAEIGVSKTVLYRYFVDKNDLTTAVMMRFAQTTLIPNMAAALTSNLDGFDLTREVIRVYVETVANEPEPYRFVMANSSASKSKVIADSERIIARMLAVMMRRRMQQAGMDTGGVEPWAYLIVGGVQLATHSWMSNPRMSRDELIDYLTMLSWNALAGSSRSADRWRNSAGNRILRRSCRHERASSEPKRGFGPRCGFRGSHPPRVRLGTRLGGRLGASQVLACRGASGDIAGSSFGCLYPAPRI